MGTGQSKGLEGSANGGVAGAEDREDVSGGGQLYVSLKMESSVLKGQLVPHVFGSAPLVGSWDSSKALSMERESASMWELSFVVPPNHETLDFKFLLIPKDGNMPCFVEEGPNRVLTNGSLEGDAMHAVFKLNADEVLDCHVFIKPDRVSPFDLAASWRAYRENLQPSTVCGIPDISINSDPQAGTESGSSASLDLDIERYVVPSPISSTNSVYAANLAATPRYIASRSNTFYC